MEDSVMLKKLLVPVVAVLLVLLTACGEAPSPEPSSSELSEPVFESSSSSSSSSSLSSPEEELSPDEKLLNLRFLLSVAELFLNLLL